MPQLHREAADRSGGYWHSENPAELFIHTWRLPHPQQQTITGLSAFTLLYHLSPIKSINSMVLAHVIETLFNFLSGSQWLLGKDTVIDITRPIHSITNLINSETNHQ
jgi:hypothetical protein